MLGVGQFERKYGSTLNAIKQQENRKKKERKKEKSLVFQIERKNLVFQIDTL